MKILLIIGHQKPGSFCHAIAGTARETLLVMGHDVIFHDLYAEEFDPILPDEEIPKEARVHPVVQRHCDELLSADGYVIVHPNWWAMPPAVLKGWIDRVMRQGVAYQFGPGGVEPLLSGKRAVVLTTSNTPREDELRLFGDPLENLWKTCIFGFCGATNFYRRNFDPIILSTPEQRAEWLGEVRTIISHEFAVK
jgi:NAD(P)H dehydrogenase (quinone)